MVKIKGLERSDLPNFLPEDETNKLISEAQEGNLESRNKLIVHNLRTVSWVVNKKFYNLPYHKDEMFSHGLMGLFKAIKSFKYGKGGFINYSTMCVTNDVLKYLQKAKKNSNKNRINETIYSNAEYNIDDIIKELVDMSVPIDDDKHIKEVDTKNMVESLLSRLSDRDNEIMSKLYGIGCDAKFQREVAEDTGLTQSYICRIEKRCLKQMREWLHEDEKMA